MSVYQPEAPPRLGWEMAKRFAIGAVIIVMLSATAVASAVLLEVHDAINIIEKESVPIPGIGTVLDDVRAGEPKTILVLGSDRRFGDGKGSTPRSDTIILVRLDPEKGATAIMSLPRDLKVDIPGHGTDKINAAYANGGPKLTVRTVRQLLGIKINHVINVNFGGFQRAVNRLGCVYTDIDRRYFNDKGGPGGYATINLQPGYQRLCGKDSLDYVRFRHTDSDFVRAARQQEFLRQAKDQFGLGKVFGDRDELLKIFGRYTQTDIAQKNDAAILSLIRLAYESSKNPLTEIPVPANVSGEYVEISFEDLSRTVDRFIDVKGRTKGQKGKDKPKPKKVRRKRGLAPGLVPRQEQGENHVLNIETKLPRSLPVYFPKAILARGGYDRDSPRMYTIRDRNKNRYKAYRIVLDKDDPSDPGQYYGVQGTTWKAAPILDNPTDEVRMNDRTYQRYFDGGKIRMIAWKTPKAAYWVSNSLTRALTNRQMMDIARSLQRIGQ